MLTTNSQTQNSSTGSLTGERIAWQRLWLVGLFAIIASVIVTAVIAIAARSLLLIHASTTQRVGVFTVIGALGAVLVFALVARFSRRPIRLFRIIATVVLVLTFIPDLALFSFLGGAASVTVLLLMHVATYLICVGMLTTMTRAR
ncbi:MAG TPA: DUF6069 family protein [Ktedonosporobacter sp.]|nr:DUF6069 family protein [Ktedonosporobacter sp.]